MSSAPRDSRFRPTRRAALLFAGAALAAPALHRLAYAQTGGAAVRRSAHELTERDQVVRSLRRGIEVMRQRDAAMPPGLPHPGGWRQGALYHAQICGPSARMPGGARDPNIEVHGGWWFLPWHRAYLATMELLLRQASGDPALALPYWDVHANPSVPPIYQGDPATNPLAHANRQLGVFASAPTPFSGSGRQTERQAVRAPSFAEFAGARPVGGRFIPGHLEMESHNSAHAFVGGDMNSFTTSGFDPLFYALHANVDRLWEVWRNQGGGRAVPNDQVWGSRRFAFQNQSGGMLQVAARDLGSTRGVTFMEFGLNGARSVPLGYAYDRDSFGAFGGVAGAAPSGAPREYNYALETAERAVGPAGISLKVAGGSGSGLSAPASANGAGAPAAPPPVTTGSAVDLVLTGLALPQAPARLVLEARRPGGEAFPLTERVLMPILAGEAAEQSRLSLSLEAGPGLLERNLRPAEVEFLLRLETPGGEQRLSFERAALRYR